MHTTQTWEIGDCRELMRRCPDNHFDLILTDPPYGIGYHSGWYVGGNPHNPLKNDAVFDEEFNDLWLSVASHKAKETSSILCFAGYQVINEWIPIINRYWNVKNVIIWVKNNWSAGDLTGNLGNQYECIIFATRGGVKLRGRRWSNVWNFDRVPPTTHPTEKPVSLLMRGVEMLTDVGDNILDPFLGSGSILEACRKTTRNCSGFEISDEWEKHYANRAMSHTPTLSSYF